MKNTLFLFAFLFLLSACMPTVAVLTRTPVPATSIPIPSPTITPLPTDTQLPTASPTPEASPTATFPPYFAGAAKTMDQVPDIGSLDNVYALARYYAAQPPVVIDTFLPTFGPQDYPDSTTVTIYCNYQGHTNCACLATIRVGDDYYAVVQVATKAGPRNLLLYLSFPDLQYEKGQVQEYFNDMNAGKGFQLQVFLREKELDLSNKKVYQWGVGPTDPLPDDSMKLDNGVITDTQETKIMFTKVSP